MEQIEKKSFLKEYLITILISFVIGIGLFFLFFFLVDNGGLVGAIDGTGITGLILICVGLLIYISREGFFDILSYGFKQFGSMLFARKANQNNDFASYKNERNVERQSKSKYYLFVMLTGLIFETAFLVLEIIYHSMF